ncbi:hypothetical protein SLS60_001871 [Paraconiothyrium brasiliense]|uniref:Riboflavin kinase n=1 Tax=Paraconiothyrium brasiliense TaxID=300254 RepID=A0ABR3S0K1_9PLEO
MGRSVGYGSLSIWTHHLQGIEYLPSFEPTACPVDEPLRAARAGAGTTGIEAQTAMAKHNSVLVTGSNPDVGLVGWLTGGGHGPLSSTYGMGADNLLEAMVVTPSGDILIANPCQNFDLFFAIRGGGGGTYGVVTEVVVKTYPDPKTTKIVLEFSTTGPNVTTEYWDLIGFIHADMQRLKEGGLSGYYFMVGPPLYPTYAFYALFTIYDKPNGTMEKLFAPTVEKLESRPDLFQYTSNISQANTFLEAYGTATDEPVAGGGSAYASWLLSSKSLEQANVTAKLFSEIGPSINASAPNGIFSNPTLLGHMIASPNTPSYYPSTTSMNPAWRNTLTHFIVAESWLDGIAQPAIDSVYRDVTAKVQKLRDLSPETGAYFNEPDSYEPEWQHAFFGKHYEKLKEVKTVQPPFPLKLRGPVVKGFGRGSKDLGIPTANIPLTGLSIGGHDDLESGIYYGYASLDHSTIPALTTEISVPSATGDTAIPQRSSNHAVADLETPVTAPPSRPITPGKLNEVKVYPTVLSIGYNPYYKNSHRSIEIHILHSFAQDFYGATLSLIILGHIRPEYDYVSKEALVEDIREDIRVAQRSLARPAYQQWQQDEWLFGEGGKKQSGQAVTGAGEADRDAEEAKREYARRQEAKGQNGILAKSEIIP